MGRRSRIRVRRWEGLEAEVEEACRREVGEYVDRRGRRGCRRKRVKRKGSLIFGELGMFNEGDDAFRG